jgi:drug/metabolite transporter (DMT)-like permease
MDALVFSFLLSVLTFLLTIPFLFFVDFSSVSIPAVFILYGKTILGAAAFLLVMHGIQKNELSNSLPLLALTPAVVALAAFFILGEAIGIRGFFGMALLLCGTYFLQLEKNGTWKSPFLFLKRNKAQWYIIGAILLFSTTTILDKTLLRDFKLQPEAFLPLQQLFLSLNFLLFILFRRVEMKGLGTAFKQGWKLILLVAVFAVVYRYSHILAMKAGPVALVLSI